MTALVFTRLEPLAERWNAAAWRGLWVSMLSLVATAARADDAEAAFERAKKDFEAGNYAAACPGFDASRVSSQPDSVFSAGYCYERWNKSHSALLRYEEYVALVAQLDASQRKAHGSRLGHAREAVWTLQPLVPRIELVLSEPLPPELELALDHVSLEPRAFTAPVSVDPGAHVLEARDRDGSGRVLWSQVLELDAGEVRRVEIRLVSSPPGTPAQPPAPQHGAARVPPASAPFEPDHAVSEPHRTVDPLVWVAGSVALAGITTGTIAGVSMLRQLKIRDEECAQSVDGTGRRPCSDAGIRAVRRASDNATVATVGFAVGIAGLAGTGLLLIRAVTESEPPALASWRPQFDLSSDGGWLGVQQCW